MFASVWRSCLHWVHRGLPLWLAQPLVRRENSSFVTQWQTLSFPQFITALSANIWETYKLVLCFMHPCCIWICSTATYVSRCQLSLIDFMMFLAYSLLTCSPPPLPPDLLQPSSCLGFCKQAVGRESFTVLSWEILNMMVANAKSGKGKLSIQSLKTTS